MPRRGEKPPPEDERPPTRLEAMRADGVSPQLPPCPLPQMVEWLFEAGPVAVGGMAVCPLGWTDLAAWQDCVGLRLRPWEARLLRQMSSAYADQLSKADKPDCPPPWAPDQTRADQREAVARKLSQTFRAMSMAQNTQTTPPKGSRRQR